MISTYECLSLMIAFAILIIEIIKNNDKNLYYKSLIAMREEAKLEFSDTKLGDEYQKAIQKVHFAKIYLFFFILAFNLLIPTFFLVFSNLNF